MQDNKLYVGNLCYSTKKEEVHELFAGHGEVHNVDMIEGKGFGFVEMVNLSAAETAKEALNGVEFKGRVIKVDKAQPPRKRPDKGGFQPRAR